MRHTQRLSICHHPFYYSLLNTNGSIPRWLSRFQPALCTIDHHLMFQTCVVQIFPQKDLIQNVDSPLCDLWVAHQIQFLQHHWTCSGISINTILPTITITLSLSTADPIRSVNWLKRNWGHFKDHKVHLQSPLLSLFERVIFEYDGTRFVADIGCV